MRDDTQDPSGSDSRANESLRLGIYLLQETDDSVREWGQSAKKVEDLWGTATEYLVTAEDGADLLLRDTRWDNGHRDVRVVERHDTPPPYDTVIGRLRISVDPVEDDLFMELRQARITRTGRAQAAVATLEELDEGSGTSVSRALRNLGAQLGTKEALLGRTDQTRERMCCRFPPSSVLVPPAAFVLTRIAPVGRGYRRRYS